MEESDTQEEERLRYVAYQKERYCCFKCKHLYKSQIFTTPPRTIRPSIECIKTNSGYALDHCGRFEEGKYQVQQEQIIKKNLGAYKYGIRI